MKIIYNKCFPGKNIIAINLFEFIFARHGTKFNAQVIQHETIHTLQMREMLYIPFYLWYGIEWLIRIVQYKDVTTGYFNISFEREAYACDLVDNYLNTRKFWSWVKYLENKS